MARLFIDTLMRYRQQRRFWVHDFVVMPDHFHLLLTPLDVTLERALQFIKGGFSYRVKKELGLNTEVWARGYVDHRIRDAGDYARHVEYIRANPIKACLAENAKEYPYCSAYADYDVDPRPDELNVDE